MHVAVIATGALVLASVTALNASAAASTWAAPDAAHQTTQAAVRTVRCPTTFGADGQSVPTPPASMVASLDAIAAEKMRFYVGGLTVLAPAGWSCTSQVGADGSAAITVHPQGTRTQGVSATDMSACAGCIAYLACPFFPNASIDLGFPCPDSVPPRETTRRVEPHVVSFLDPPGVKGNGLYSGGTNPARGLVIYLPPSARGPAADEVLCTLPQGQQRLCDAILTNYLASYKKHYPWPRTRTSADTASAVPSLL